jgi:hypothetical protein
MIERDAFQISAGEWRAYWRGGLLAATWNSKGAADAHLDLLAKGVCRPQYAQGCEGWGGEDHVAA